MSLTTLEERVEMSRKPKRSQNMALKTTHDNEQFAIAKAHVEGITASEYIHRLITAERLKCENDLRILGAALGLQINKVNKD